MVFLRDLRGEKAVKKQSLRDSREKPADKLIPRKSCSVTEVK